uniref:Apolipoprotein M n=1 Tax=Oryzias melastigma TaxID=30732 RepID=A0A3B3BGU8_ORYME
MSALLCLALLALSSLTAASDLDCDELVKPSLNQSKVSGRWIFQVGISDTEEQMEFLKSVNSSWMEIQTTPKSEGLNLHFGDRIDGKCMYGTANSSVSGNSTRVTFYYNSTSHEVFGKLLESCPDCAVWSDYKLTEEMGKTKKHRNLYLFTKTGKLDDKNLEVFKKQAECLHFSTDFYFPQTTHLCPDEKDSDEKADEQ